MSDGCGQKAAGGQLTRSGQWVEPRYRPLSAEYSADRLREVFRHRLCRNGLEGESRPVSLRCPWPHRRTAHPGMRMPSVRFPGFPPLARREPVRDLDEVYDAVTRRMTEVP